VITEEDRKTQPDVDVIVANTQLGQLNLVDSQHDAYVRGDNKNNDYVLMPPTDVKIAKSNLIRDKKEALNARVCAVDEEKNEDKGEFMYVISQNV